jgi:MFS family permease
MRIFFSLLKKNINTLAVLTLFAAVYVRSLTFAYIEGDDARSFLFHVFGRNPELQRPYSKYHGMMDLFLSVLPADEAVIRHVGIAFSAASAVLMVVLLLHLVFGWLDEKSPRRKLFASVVLLGSIPEFFYFGLIYNPTIVAMCFVLSAHLLVRKIFGGDPDASLATPRRKALFILSLLLFGIGAACRWNISLYAFVIVVDIAMGGPFGAGISFNKSRFFMAFLWGLLSGPAVLLAIYVSGYSLMDIVQILTWAQEWGESEVIRTRSIFYSIGAAQTWATPAFILFFLGGIWQLIKRRDNLIIIGMSGFVPLIPYISSGNPKVMLFAFPSFVLCLILGAHLFWNITAGRRGRILARIGIVLIILGPWLFGLKVYSDSTLWGPGFGLRSFVDAPRKLDANNLSGGGPAYRIGNYSLTMKAGFTIPTPEGPRPLGGHLSSLVGSEWRGFASGQAKAFTSAIQHAADKNSKIMIVNEGEYFVWAFMTSLGYTTREKELVKPSACNIKASDLEKIRREMTQSEKDMGADAWLVGRRFFDASGKTLWTIQPPLASFFDPKEFQKIMAAVDTDEITVITTASSRLRKIYNFSPKSFQPLNSRAAIMDMQDYARSVMNK